MLNLTNKKQYKTNYGITYLEKNILITEFVDTNVQCLKATPEDVK